MFYEAKKARQVRSKETVMLTVFFNHKGIVYHSMHRMIKLLTTVLHQSSPLAARCNVTQATCVVWGDWQLQHDNAPAHSYHLVQNFLPKHQIPQVPLPPNSPDMTLSEFFYIPKGEMLLKGNRLQDMEEIKCNTMTQLLAIPKSRFQKCCRQWKDHTNNCVVSEGDYDCNTKGQFVSFSGLLLGYFLIRPHKFSVSLDEV